MYIFMYLYIYTFCFAFLFIYKFLECQVYNAVIFISSAYLNFHIYNVPLALLFFCRQCSLRVGWVGLSLQFLTAIEKQIFKSLYPRRSLQNNIIVCYPCLLYNYVAMSCVPVTLVFRG